MCQTATKFWTAQQDTNSAHGCQTAGTLGRLHDCIADIRCKEVDQSHRQWCERLEEADLFCACVWTDSKIARRAYPACDQGRVCRRERRAQRVAEVHAALRAETPSPEARMGTLLEARSALTAEGAAAMGAALQLIDREMDQLNRFSFRFRTEVFCNHC